MKTIYSLLLFLITFTGGLVISSPFNNFSGYEENVVAATGQGLHECFTYAGTITANYIDPTLEEVFLLELCRKGKTDDISGVSFLTIDSSNRMHNFNIKHASTTGSEFDVITDRVNGKAYRYHGLFLYPRWKGYYREQLAIGKLEIMDDVGITKDDVGTTKESIIGLNFIDSGMVENYINDHLKPNPHYGRRATVDAPVD